MKIAMWSGPRNLSTALMYAFGNRPDCDALDEPFYAAYLAASGLDHPLRDRVIAWGETDPDRVAASLRCGPRDDRHLYLKLMTHHMLPGFDVGWARGFRNVFLIRHPARVVASYAAKRERPTLDDLGFARQLEILEAVFAWGDDPIVIDSSDIQHNPPRALRSLCKALGLPFDPAMLSWPAGPKSFDGIWAEHWYGAVHRSTGFVKGEPDLPLLDGDYAALADAAMPIYQDLRFKRLGAPRSRAGKPS